MSDLKVRFLQWNASQRKKQTSLVNLNHILVSSVRRQLCIFQEKIKLKNKSFFFCSFAKVFSRENKLFPRFAKVFSTKFVPKTAKRESLFHKFRVFFDTRKFLPAKVSALKLREDIFRQ